MCRPSRSAGPYQWRAQIRRKGYPEQSRTFDTKADAEAWASVIESEMQRGLFVSRAESERTTLLEALERYANEVTANKKGSKRELGRINRWKQHPFAKRFLATLKSSDFAKFRDEWRRTGKAENTIRMELALLSHLFETARKEWGMEGLVNPVRNIKAPGGSNQRDRRAG